MVEVFETFFFSVRYFFLGIKLLAKAVGNIIMALKEPTLVYVFHEGLGMVRL